MKLLSSLEDWLRIAYNHAKFKCKSLTNDKGANKDGFGV